MTTQAMLLFWLDNWIDTHGVVHPSLGWPRCIFTFFIPLMFNLSGFYHTGSYVEAASAQKALDSALAAAGAGGVAKPKAGA